MSNDLTHICLNETAARRAAVSAKHLPDMMAVVNIGQRDGAVYTFE